MCAPAAFAVVGMVFQLYQGQQEQRRMEQQAKYEEAVARNDAIMNQRAQEQEEKLGRREEALRRLQTTQDVNTAKSKIAGQGFDVNEGSALTKQSDIRAMGNVEAMTIRSNKQNRIYDLQVDNTRRQAAAQGRAWNARAQGQAAFNKGVTGAISTGFSAYNQGAFSGGSVISNSSATMSGAQWKAFGY